MDRTPYRRLPRSIPVLPEDLQDWSGRAPNDEIAWVPPRSRGRQRQQEEEEAPAA